MTTPAPLSKISLLGATLLSGLLWYFAIDISGRYGFLLWVAPIPVIWLSLQSSKRLSFAAAAAAYFLGRLNWIPFLLTLMPIVPIVLLTVLPPLLFGTYILLNRWIVLKTRSAWSVFAYPVIVAASEFLVFNNPVDGTAGSLAYTQVNYLPVIQIASLTGIWGIVFVASLIPAAIAISWHFRVDPSKFKVALFSSTAVVVLVLAFGLVRMNVPRAHEDVSVGITSISEGFYADRSDPTLARQRIVDQYRKQITALAAQDARYVLFPEKILHLRAKQKDSLVTLFQAVASATRSTIIGGMAVLKDSSRLNLVEFIPPTGPVQEYQKRFHVKGFEGDFEPGNKVGKLSGTPFKAAMAICKDMDFPGWLRGFSDADLLFVPAWDFRVDGWLHSRMAVLRGVENGFTIVRAGRQGRLTISDYRGKIVAEVNADEGNEASLLAQAPIYHVDTLYSKWGDWFGWLMLLSFALIIVSARLHPKS